MSEDFGPTFLTVTDEEGKELVLEFMDALEYNGQLYQAFFPAETEGEEDDPDAGLVILKVLHEDGEDIQDEEKADCPDSGPDDPAMPLELAHVAGGEVVWLGDFYLDYGDRIRYDVLAQAGSDMQVGFASPGDSALDTTYFSVHNWRGETEGLRCTASFLFTSESPVRPGEYRLFLRSTGEALTLSLIHI